MIAPDLAAAVAELEPLLLQQATVLRAGDADALPALAAAMRGPLAVLARHAPRGLPAALRPRIEALSAQAAAARVLVARRSHAVQESLAALGRNHAGLQEIQQQGVYGQRGALSGGWRGTSFQA